MNLNLQDDMQPNPYANNVSGNPNIASAKDEIANLYGTSDFEQIDRGNITSRANGNITRALVEMAENKLAEENQ